MSENIQTRIYTKKPEKDSFFNFQISWTLLLAFFFILFIVGVVPAIIYSTKYIENNYSMNIDAFNIIYFCYFLLVVNYFIFTYTMCIYYARKYKKGPKGGKGKLGDPGPQGVDSSCDICSKKTTLFKRRDDVSGAKEIVDDSLLKKLEMLDFNNWIKLKQTRNVLGSNNSRINKSYNTNTKTYLNGAVVGFNNSTNEILSLQFFEDANPIPDKTKKNNILTNNRFGNVNISDNYDGTKENTNIKSFEFECPAGSGISKIETLNKDNKLKGISFQCSNIDDGSLEVGFEKKFFGIEPKHTAPGSNKYSSFECKKFEGKPTFISNLSAEDTDNEVNALSVNTCSYSRA